MLEIYENSNIFQQDCVSYHVCTIKSPINYLRQEISCIAETAQVSLEHYRKLDYP